MKKILSLVVLLSGMIGLLPGDTAAQEKKNPNIILPVGPTVPAVMPSTPTKLTKGVRYVVRSKVSCDYLSFPNDVIVWEVKTGPRDWTGIFAGSDGKEEDRRFEEPFLYSGKAVKTGKVVTYFFPKNYKDKSEWVVVDLDVDASDPCEKKEPTPEPKPKPPEPEPKPAPKLGKQFVVVLMDRLNSDPSQVAALGNKAFRDYLKAKGHELEIIDTGSDAGKKRLEQFQEAFAIWKVSGVPAMALLDAETKPPGLVRSVVSLPNTAEDIIASIKSTTGDK